MKCASCLMMTLQEMQHQKSPVRMVEIMHRFQGKLDLKMCSSVGEDGISSNSELKVENDSNVAFDSASRQQDVTVMSNASTDEQDAESLVGKHEVSIKCKRNCDQHLDNPKPWKCRRLADESLDLSRQYCDFSFCGVEDYLPDGFYDAGRDQPFMPLSSYERNLPIDSREVILVDRFGFSALCSMSCDCFAPSS